MANNIGLNVIEVDGSAPSTIEGAAVSVAAFNIVTKRGVPNVPTRVTSFTEFTERFGGFDAASLGAYIVKGFFDNGGQRAYVNRVTAKTNASASPATAAPTPSAVTLQRPDTPAVNILKLEGGYRGQLDPGKWLEGTGVVVAPSFQTPLKATPPGGTATTVDANGTFVAAMAGFSVGDTVVVVKGTTTSPVLTITTLDPVTGKIAWSPAINPAIPALDGGSIVASTDFDLTITPPGAPSPAETWPRLTMRRGATNYAPTVVNDPMRGSKLVRATDARPDTLPPAVPDAFGRRVAGTLTGGLDGTAPAATDYSGDAAARTGLRALDPLDVQLVCCDRTDVGLAQAALDYCQARGDCMYIGAVPEAYVASRGAIEYGGGLQSKNAYGALYGPWITVADPLPGAATPTRRIPPVGHVAGMYARIETTRGIHKAPAGDEARLFGALDVEYRLSDAEHTDLVQLGSVNGIRAIPGAGIVVDASRTLSKDIRWRYVNVRLLFNYVKSSLKQGLRWVKQEPNRDQLWDAVKYGSVQPFLMGLWRQGAFGTGEPDDVFTVVCDATNNPPDEVDKGNFKVEVYFYPSKPAETILVVVGQQPSGGSAADR